MSIKDQIRAEIERLKIKACGSQAKEEEITAALASLDLVIRFLNSLPEQPVEGLEEEIERYWKEEMPVVLESDLNDIARHFAEWQKEQTEKRWIKDRDGCFWDGVEEGKKAMREQMMKDAVEGLEEAAKEYATKWHKRPDGSLWKCIFPAGAIRDFIAGAEWMKSKSEK